MKFLDKLFMFNANKPIISLMIVLSITTLMAFGIFFLYVDNDILHWFNRESDVARLDYHIRETFRVNNPIIIAVDWGRDVFSYDILSHTREISKILKSRNDVVKVLSLTEADDIKSDEEGILITSLIPDDIPSDQNELEKLRSYVMSKESYFGSIVSRDGKFSSIIVILSPEVNASDSAREIRTLVENYTNTNNLNVKIYFGGTPMILNSISKIVVDNIKTLTPFVSVVVLFSLLISFRRIYGTLLPLITVLFATASGLGIMGYLGYFLNPFAVAIPVVLIAIGNAYGIHVMNEYYERLNNFQPRDAIIFVQKRIFIPVFMSALTTISGFTSLAIVNEMISARNFAIVSIIGIFLAFVFTITFVPAMLRILPSGKVKVWKIDDHLESSILSNVSKIFVKYRFVVIIITIVIAGVSIFFATKAKTGVDYISFFSEKSEPRIVSDKIGDVFEGSFEIRYYLKGNIQSPEMLKIMYIIEEETRFEVGGKQKFNSITEIIASLNDAMINVKSIPDYEQEIQNLWFFIEGNESIRMIVSDDKTETSPSMLISKIPSEERDKIISKIKYLLESYKTFDTIPRSEAREFLTDIISKAIYNRLVRAGIKIDRETIFTKISERINSIELSEDVTDYENKKAILKNLVSWFYRTFDINENKISYKDIEYAFSPLVWNKIPIPKNNLGNYKVIESSGVAGITNIFSQIEKRLLRNQITTIFLTLIFIILLNTITFKSPYEGLISTIPIILTVLVNFGLIGLLGINLDYIIVTISAIAMGVGIDYTIHFVSRFTFERENGADYLGAIYRTVATTGRGIIFNALSVGLGFAVLMFSDIIPLRNFGLLMLINMIVSSVATLVVLPGILVFSRKILGFVGEIVGNSKNFLRR